MKDRILSLLEGDAELTKRILQLQEFSRTVRASEYHVTNACNIRCKGCWFFEYGFDHSPEERSPLVWKEFARRQAAEGITAALLIGGEPTLYLDRIASFVESMRYVTISTNGLRAFPMEGFEDVAVALTLFGGGALDDDLRGVKPNGRTFTGLLETTLRNYRNDSRATFIYALAHEGIHLIEDTVKRIEDNGNKLTFNYYSRYGSADPLQRGHEEQLIDEAMRMKQLYSDTVVCHPFYIRTLITGQTDWGSFGYDVCPSISSRHPAHEERLRNGNPVLPGFNAFAADTESVNFCCTSGHCQGCRDSQAVYSWLLVNLSRFLESKRTLETWVAIAESYWRQFVWSPYHGSAKGR